MINLNEFNKNTFFLLAISGGLDSMILLNIFYKKGVYFEVAHVNYGLRNLDSDLDQKLVQDFCIEKKIPFHLKKVNFSEYKISKNSTQMIAREIRYNFFNTILNQKENGILVTAHHLDDQIETFFINLLRSSGLKGLSGMKTLKNNIFRPFLNISKNDLLNYAQENLILWREDKSNKKREYLRNKIRLDLVPVLEKIEPNYKNQIQKSIEFINQSEDFIQNIIEKKFKNLIKYYDKKNKVYFLKLKKIQKLNPLFLHYILNKFGGVPQTEIQKFLNSTIGTKFSNDSFNFWIDYKFFIIEPKNEPKNINKIIKKLEFNIKNPVKLKTNILDYMDSSANAWFDADKIQLPITIRNWKNTDIFFPINMNGSKKVSKYLKDIKLSAFFKKNILVMVDKNDTIFWIINQRTDDRFKVNEQTNKIINIWTKP